MVCDETNEDQSKKELRYKERDREERIKYYQLLRELIKRYGIESLVYIDECGFEQTKVCLYGWVARGKKIYGEKQGKRSRKENLVAGRRKRKKDLIAPMILTGSLHAGGFEGWLSL
jgi:putative transposase